MTANRAHTAQHSFALALIDAIESTAGEGAAGRLLIDDGDRRWLVTVTPLQAQKEKPKGLTRIGGRARLDA